MVGSAGLLPGDLRHLERPEVPDTRGARPSHGRRQGPDDLHLPVLAAAVRQRGLPEEKCVHGTRRRLRLALQGRAGACAQQVVEGHPRGCAVRRPARGCLEGRDGLALCAARGARAARSARVRSRGGDPSPRPLPVAGDAGTFLKRRATGGGPLAGVGGRRHFPKAAGHWPAPHASHTSDFTDFEAGGRPPARRRPRRDRPHPGHRLPVARRAPLS
mmetsp:Transcript_107333/g.280309  ORF Transcript_107333/g.280309 Transcript_107333/m.280309 type:complete len:216 (-) Transcript_107333:93-740(-)